MCSRLQTHHHRLWPHSCSRIAKATGATMVMTLADMEGNETFDPAHLGSAEEVVEERVADDNMIMIKVGAGLRHARRACVTGFVGYGVLP